MFLPRAAPFSFKPCSSAGPLRILQMPFRSSSTRLLSPLGWVSSHLGWVFGEASLGLVILNWVVVDRGGLGLEPSKCLGKWGLKWSPAWTSPESPTCCSKWAKACVRRGEQFPSTLRRPGRHGEANDAPTSHRALTPDPPPTGSQQSPLATAVTLLIPTYLQILCWFTHVVGDVKALESPGLSPAGRPLVKRVTVSDH